MYKAICVLLSFSAVTACGGSGGSGVEAYSDREAEALNLFSDLSALGFSDPSTLPVTTGTVTYIGSMGAADPYGGRIIGDLNVGVSFADNSLSGTANNFIDSVNDTYTGELNITNGVIDRGANPDTEYTFSADVNGVLSANDSSTLVSADMLGDFTGASQEGMVGILSGSATTPGFGTQILNANNTAFAAAK